MRNTRLAIFFRVAATLVVGAFAVPAVWATTAVHNPATPARECAAAKVLPEALVQSAAALFEQVFTDVAASTRAIGQEYAAVQVAAASAEDVDAWQSRATTNGDTTRLRSWPHGMTEPAFQAPHAALYSYNGAQLTAAMVYQLQGFEQLVPVLRSAYRTE